MPVKMSLVASREEVVFTGVEYTLRSSWRASGKRFLFTFQDAHRASSSSRSDWSSSSSSSSSSNSSSSSSSTMPAHDDDEQQKRTDASNNSNSSIVVAIGLVDHPGQPSQPVLELTYTELHTESTGENGSRKKKSECVDEAKCNLRRFACLLCNGIINNSKGGSSSSLQEMFCCEDEEGTIEGRVRQYVCAASSFWSK